MDTDGLEAYADDLFRAALRICGNWNDAEEILKQHKLSEENVQWFLKAVHWED